MYRLRAYQVLALAAGCLGVLPFAFASLVRAMDLAELTSSADQIVVGEILSVRDTWDTAHRNIYSTIEVGVHESWKGTPPADGRITIRQLGGTVGEIEMTVHGMPTFSVGERSLLFLRGSHVVGMGQGRRPLRWEPQSGRWFADTSDRSSVVEVGPQGRLRAAAPGRRETLDDLREKVRALMGR